MWADTTTQEAESGGYTNFVAMHGGDPQSLIGDTVSLFLPQSNLYFDVSILSWDGGNTGGGFSYSRTSITLGLDGDSGPTGFRISNNYPNPFNPSTRIQLQLPQSATVNLVIYNCLLYTSDAADE